MAVQTMTMVLNKSCDEYLALLNYRHTPLYHGYYPAQLSMAVGNYVLESPVTRMSWSQTPDCDHIRRKDSEYRTKMKFNYDQRHRTQMDKSEGTGGWHEEFLMEDLQSHPRMWAMRAENQHERERWAQTFPRQLEPAKETTENCLSLRTYQQ